MEHVQRRGGRYFWRSRVPVDIVPLVGRLEIVLRLATSDRRVAQMRAARHHVSVIDLWAEVRSIIGGTTEQVRQTIGALLGALSMSIYAEVASAAGGRRTMLSMLGTADRLDMHAGVLAGLPAIMLRVGEAEAQAGTTARAAAVAGAMGPESFAQFRDLLGSVGVRSAAAWTPTVTRFLDDTYAIERQLREDAKQHINGYVRLFARTTGDQALADYKRSDVIKWVRTLEKIRTSHGKRKGDANKTIAQIIKEAKGVRTLGVTTIQKHITHLQAFFLAASRHYKWCSRDDIEDLFRDIPLSAHVPGVNKRKSWTVEQLNGLFASPIWSGTRSVRGNVTKRHEPGPQIHRNAYWWLPVAAPWTGTRLEELAQLQHEDLAYDRERIPYLRICRDGDRRLKNDHSVRNVPVHNFLIGLGFCELFRPGKRGRVWPELKLHGRPPSWGGLFSSHFTDYRRACGLYEPWRDFYSFRRTFISMLRNRAGVDALTIAAIVGHDNRDPELQRVRQTDEYTDYSIAALAAAVNKLDYAAYGVDLGTIMATAAVCGPRESTRIEKLDPRQSMTPE